MLKMENFRVPIEARAAIAGSLMATGVSRADANEAVGLAVFAAEQAIGQILAIAERGSQGGVKLSALEIGVQLAASHCDRIKASMDEVARDKNFAQAAAVIVL